MSVSHPLAPVAASVSAPVPAPEPARSGAIRPAPPWALTTGTHSVLSRWKGQERMRKCFTADRTLPAEEAHYAPLPEDLLPALKDALRKRGIEQLYRHQAKAIAAVREAQSRDSDKPRHVVIATPTASGKSLCFHLPVLDAIARDPEATALYLYPTKALSRDQEHNVRTLIDEAGLAIGATVYDGDTPGDARRAAREQARLVMTNPDMLHAGILPQHAHWARTLQKLRYVVVDELHCYRGVFGSHVAHVLSRLRRIARFHGADPQFICATATIGNPTEHTARLIDASPSDVTTITHSSAPRGERRVMVYNPPVVNAQLGVRASYIKSAVRLVTDLIEARVRTIVFGQSRNNVEIMLKYLRDRFAADPAIRDGIVAYRGGYLPDQRRRVERGLRDGDVLCVVATSALELGIDIGDLDAAVCAGYPGTLAGTWQRFGRAGRRGDSSLAVLVSSSAPLNQYAAQHPEVLLDGAIEEARIDPDNTEILIQHLKCAAFELPFRRGDNYAGLPAEDTEAALEFLEQHGVVHGGRERFHWSDEAFPANHVSLRNVGWDNFVIIDLQSGETLAELDWHSTPSMLHEQAIYQHDGAQYQVERLDYENHKAYVRLVEPDYFTTAMRRIDVRVLDESAEGPLANQAREAQPECTVGWGEVCVTEKIVGYKKIKFHTHENAGYGDIRLPPIDMHTTSFWLTVPAAICHELGRASAVEGLRGLGHALELIATLALMCDPHDIRRAIGDASPGERERSDANHPNAAHSEEFSATVFLYDAVPGGVGLAERIHQRAAELCQRTAELIRRCPCDLGCPSCVGATAVAVSDGPRGTSDEPPPFNRKSCSQALLARLGMRA